MAKQSEYLKRREAEWNAVFNAGAAMAMQFAMDTLQMALHQTEGWGYDRIMRITHNWVIQTRKRSNTGGKAWLIRLYASASGRGLL